MEQYKEANLNVLDFHLNLDFRFVENYYELDALGDYLNVLEDQLSLMVLLPMLVKHTISSML